MQFKSLSMNGDRTYKIGDLVGLPTGVEDEFKLRVVRVTDFLEDEQGESGCRTGYHLYKAEDLGLITPPLPSDVPNYQSALSHHIDLLNSYS